MTCKFCEIGSGLHRNEVDHPIAESDRYFAISSVGGFVPGWTLIFPKEHRFNMSPDYCDAEFLEFVAKVSLVVEKEYGKCIFFEHGATKQNSITGCGVNHAHFHIVPLKKDIEELVAAYGPEYPWTKIFPSEIKNHSNGSEYLYCSNNFNTNQSGSIALLENSESQFFRKAVASAVGLTAFSDYKRFPFEEVSTSSSTTLRKLFSAEKEVA